MKFDQVSPPNPIDQERVVTRPHTRIEGPLKVTGQAKYAYEYQLPETPTYGFVLGAGIAKGRVASIDTSVAEAAPRGPARSDAREHARTGQVADASPTAGGRLPAAFRT